ncbi:MAG TPA: hypothetical protein VFZ33_15240 [Chitinophagaceae bacterium]
MEVHHHAHTPRKKWTHYFWEFLMLFLAVFCGFLAENQREHMVEHNREKQYMQSMLVDLAADTARFNSGIPLREDRIKSIDTVFMFFRSNPNAKVISGKLFKDLRRTSYDQNLVRNTITINQLKNAGAMRLIRNKMVADSIASYDFQFESFVALHGQYYLIHQQADFRHLEKLVNSSDLLGLYISNASAGVVGNIPDTMSIHINTEGLNELLNFLMQVKVYARQQISQIKQLERKATNLMTLIKQKYHLSEGTP